MNNRHERRAALKREAIFVDVGRLQQRDPNYGLPVDCYVCGTTHAASGLARIQDKRSTTHVPLCDACFGKDAQLMRKFLNAPDLKVSEGGTATTEQIASLAAKQDTTEH